MIAVDTSALLATLQDEVEAESRVRVLAANDRIIDSAGMLAGAPIVAAGRGPGLEFSELTEGLDLEDVSLSSAASRRVAACCATGGNRVHLAGPNLVDRPAHEVAARLGSGLLHAGDDFSRTDLVCRP